MALTRDWGGLEDGMVTGEFKAMLCRSAMPGSYSPASLECADANADMLTRSAAPVAGARPSSVFGAPLRALKSLMGEESATDNSGERPLDLLVSLQNADGSWELAKDLALVLDRELSELEAKIPDAAGQQKTIHRAWATALTDKDKRRGQTRLEPRVLTGLHVKILMTDIGGKAVMWNRLIGIR